jgi:hypothetical protein
MKFIIYRRYHPAAGEMYRTETKEKVYQEIRTAMPPNK